jgi:predicted permease
MKRDFQYAVRMLKRQPGFTAIALLTLALGIGATTAIFSVVNAVVLRPLPFPQSERLVLLFENNHQRGWATFSVAPANFVDWARESRTFESMVATGSGSAAIMVDGAAEQVPVTVATMELFTVLRAAPLLGRAFVQGDDAPGAAAIAVIGHGLWQRRFGGDAAIVGRSVTINDRPTTIVGVMPEGFGRGNPDTDLWLPLTIDRAQAERGGRSLRVLGRLSETATLEHARAEMQALAERMSRAYPANAGWGVTLVPLEEAVVGPGIRRTLLLLLGAVVFVLLIACVNVANLLLARGVARQRELAIRTALGADRWRILRQLLTESLVLAALGGTLGVFVAIWGTQVLLALAPAGIPRLLEVALDARVLAAGVAATLAAALIFGLVPALQAVTAKPDKTLKDTTRGGTANPGRRRVSHAFVVAEIGLAVVLLVGAGLLVRSFIKLSSQPIGFDPEQALTFRLSLPEARYGSPQAVTQFYRDALDRIRALPGVVAAGATHALPFSGDNSVRPFIREGESLSAENAPTSEYRLITPGYFAAMGIPVTRGREFTSSDTLGQPAAVIVTESFARQFLGGRDPIGQRLRQAGDNPEIPWMTVVGVVGDVRHLGLAADMQPEMFWPEPQATWGATLNRHRRSLTVIVRTTGDPARFISTIRAQMAAIDPNRPMIDPRPMRDLVSRSADVQRFSMVLLGIFAAVGLLLAAAGVYGVISYTVASRRREMGIRLALGANPRALLSEVLRSGLVLAIFGAGTGLAAAWALDDALRTLLFQTPPRDIVTFVSVTLLLLSTAFLACLLPARRASRVDPIEALRED